MDANEHRLKRSAIDDVYFKMKEKLLAQNKGLKKSSAINSSGSKSHVEIIYAKMRRTNGTNAHCSGHLFE